MVVILLASFAEPINRLKIVTFFSPCTPSILGRQLLSTSSWFAQAYVDIRLVPKPLVTVNTLLGKVDQGSAVPVMYIIKIFFHFLSSMVWEG